MKCLNRYVLLTRLGRATWGSGSRWSSCSCSSEVRVRLSPTSCSVSHLASSPDARRRCAATLRALLPQLPPRTASSDSVVVQGVVFRESSSGTLEVLLVHRISPRAWEVPGGKPDVGEAFDRAVEREVFEESAVVVRAVRHVATFRRTGFRPHLSPVFRCVVVGGVPSPNSEAIAAAFHPVSRLPWGTFPWLHEAIEIAVADLYAAHSTDVRPVERSQHLGFRAVARSLLIHMAGVARMRS